MMFDRQVIENIILLENPTIICSIFLIKELEKAKLGLGTSSASAYSAVALITFYVRISHSGNVFP